MAERQPGGPGRPPRAVPRASVALRLEPELLARLDAWPGQGRNAKIVALIEAGLPRLADE